ncbi:MAG: serine/threonine protein kinase [Polyangiaceae bacterium]
MAQQQQRYRVVQRIAAGGMAEVFRAESAGLEGFKKKVAIKRVLPHLSEKKQFIGMFLDEARLSAHLSHSNCVQVFDIGVGDNTYFIVMEFVDGADLKATIEYTRKHYRTFPVEEAVSICVKICEGLSYAHELKDDNGEPLTIVHRDMSPPNVLITRYGEVKIVDFGLAKANSQLEHSEPGIIKGKFSYLSPEAALGHAVDARTDIFAVGIILWEMLAGRRLFLGETDLETVRQVQAAKIPSIRELNPNVSPELEQVLLASLARDPAVRYQTARDLGRDLNEILFRSDRAVSAFDIATLVQQVIDARDQEKQARPKDKASIIGELIDDALFEFTSLEEGSEGDRSTAGDLGAAPLNLGSFENVGDWASDLEDIAGSLPPTSFQEGNLAALEDESTAPPAARPSNPGAPAKAAAPPPPRPQAPAPVAPAPASGPVSAQQPPPKGKGGLIAFILVVLVAAGAAGAYFSGKLPI